MTPDEIYAHYKQAHDQGETFAAAAHELAQRRTEQPAPEQQAEALKPKPGPAPKPAPQEERQTPAPQEPAVPLTLAPPLPPPDTRGEPLQDPLTYGGVAKELGGLAAEKALSSFQQRAPDERRSPEAMGDAAEMVRAKIRAALDNAPSPEEVLETGKRWLGGT